LRKIAAGYDVEINDLVGTSAEKAQAPLVEAGTDLHMPVVGGVVLEDLRTKAEAFVERWGETASTIKSIQIEDEGIDALLRTVEWAVRAEASTLFREFLAVPQFALRSSKVYDRVQLSEIIGEVDRVANDLLMTFISMDARSVSLLQEQEKREYSLLLAYARESARMLGDPSSGTGLGEGGMEGINRIPE
jgi:hypothetical protein